MNEASVRKAVDSVKYWHDSLEDKCRNKNVNILLSLAESWLGRKGPEKRSEYLRPDLVSNHKSVTYWNEGWNAAIDACRLASVVSEEEIEKILLANQTHIQMYHDKEGGRLTQEEVIFKQRCGEYAHAIATYINKGE